MWVIAILTQAMGGLKHVGPFNILVPFVFAVLAGQGMRAAARGLSTQIDRVTYSCVVERLVHRILEIPLRTIEQVGTARILASLTNDASTASLAQASMSSVLVQSVVVVAALGYIAWLSPLLGGFIVCALAILVLPTYFLLNRILMAKWRLCSNRYDDHLSCIHGFLDGIKELKLNEKRRMAFQQHSIGKTTREATATTANATNWMTLEITWVDLCSVGIMAIIVFAGPSVTPIDATTLNSAVLAYLWASSAFATVIATTAQLSQARAAQARITDLFNRVTGATSDVSSSPTQDPFSSSGVIEIDSVTYRFSSTDGRDGFSIGPVSLAFKPGEVVFVSGGNGSGKTTFAKVLTGLYSPTSGTVRWGGVAVTDANRDAYRQRFSAVFQEFHVFATLLGFEGGEVDESANRILAKLDLSNKVKIENGKLSTLSLSRGQLKRLALLVVLLEDRPFCILDEWAADQDPTYREIFYREVLPEMRARGKCVIAISHDDRYYGIADRIIRLESGRVVDVRTGIDYGGQPPQPSPTAAQPSSTSIGA